MISTNLATTSITSDGIKSIFLTTSSTDAIGTITASRMIPPTHCDFPSCASDNINEAKEKIVFDVQLPTYLRTSQRTFEMKDDYSLFIDAAKAKLLYLHTLVRAHASVSDAIFQRRTDLIKIQRICVVYLLQGVRIGTGPNKARVILHITLMSHRSHKIVHMYMYRSMPRL